MTDGGKEPVIIEGAANIDTFHLIQLKYALKLEIAGLHHSRGSVYAYIKRNFGFMGNKHRVLDQLVALIESRMLPQQDGGVNGEDAEGGRQVRGDGTGSRGAGSTGQSGQAGTSAQEHHPRHDAAGDRGEPDR